MGQAGWLDKLEIKLNSAQLELGTNYNNTGNVYHSSRCTKSKVKIRKKVSVTTKCAHEFIAAALNPSPGLARQATPSSTSAASPLVTALCNFCKKSFDVKTGGKCKYCRTNVLYCSKDCQVQLQCLH